jgi:hypothetical protein
VLLPDEVQQQIEWTFKLAEQDLQIVGVIVRTICGTAPATFSGARSRSVQLSSSGKSVLSRHLDRPFKYLLRVTLAICCAFSRPWSRIASSCSSLISLTRC